jgi:hypothetical protein
VLAELVEALQRRVGEAHPRLDLLALSLLALPEREHADQRREREPRNHERHEHDAVGDQDHQLSLGDRRRDGERGGECHPASHPAPAQQEPLGQPSRLARDDPQVRDRGHGEHPRETDAEHDGGDEQRVGGHVDELLVGDPVDEVDELEADEEE